MELCYITQVRFQQRMKQTSQSVRALQGNTRHRAGGTNRKQTNEQTRAEP